MQGFGALGPIWGGALGALGPIWGGASGRPKADIMEAEGRLNGGLGAEPPGMKKAEHLTITPPMGIAARAPIRAPNSWGLRPQTTI